MGVSPAVVGLWALGMLWWVSGRQPCCGGSVGVSHAVVNMRAYRTDVCAPIVPLRPEAILS